MPQQDAIWEQAFTELLISCQHSGCLQLFEPSIRQAATDPVERWASTMSNLARENGWRVAANGCVACQDHGVI